MKKLYLIVLLALLNLTVLTIQAQTDNFTIRDLKQNQVLLLNGKIFVKNIISPYGQLHEISESDQLNNLYLFQGQEYDKNLALYFFPSRVYSSKNKRFLIPDPKSQYHSPYLFVNSDPVNIVDLNGQEGKPLILYQENHFYPNGESYSLQDLKAQVHDAHYVPMSSFVNEEVGDLPEWNGNVYMIGHTDKRVGQEILLERSPEKGKLKTMSMDTNYSQYKEGEHATMDAKDFSKRLKRFSIERNVPMKNIVVGGCEGSVAAERMSDAFIEKEAPGMDGYVNIIGAKRDNDLLFTGKKYAAAHHMQGPESTRMYFIPSGKTEKMLDETTSDGRRVFKGYGVLNADGSMQELEYLEGHELNELVNGRIPARISSRYLSFEVFY